MSTTAIPGRTRFKGVFTGDYQTFVALFAGGFLVMTFFRLELLRASLLAGGTIAPAALLALLALAAAFAWGSLLRRSFLWAEPSALTWLDFGRADRVRAVSGRVWAGWSARLVAVGYVGAALAALAAAAPWVWLTVGVLVAASAAVAFAVAAGPPVPPLRLPVAVGAGRQRLVAGWAERVVRSVAVTFLDPLLMLPSSRPVGGWRLGALPRLAVAGVLGRTRFVPAAVLLALTVAVVHAVLPGVPQTLLVAVAAFAALLPFAAGLGELWRSPGKRRWLDASDRRLRAWHGLVLGGVVLAWGAVLALAVLVAAAPLAATAWLALPIAAAAVLRTVTKPPVSYDDIGTTDTPIGQLPTRLIAQVVRGPDLGALGLLLVSMVPFGLALLVTASVVAYAVVR